MSCGWCFSFKDRTNKLQDDTEFRQKIFTKERVFWKPAQRAMYGTYDVNIKEMGNILL